MPRVKESDSQQGQNNTKKSRSATAHAKLYRIKKVEIAEPTLKPLDQHACECAVLQYQEPTTPTNPLSRQRICQKGLYPRELAVEPLPAPHASFLLRNLLFAVTYIGSTRHTKATQIPGYNEWGNHVSWHLLRSCPLRMGLSLSLNHLFRVVSGTVVYACTTHYQIIIAGVHNKKSRPPRSLLFRFFFANSKNACQ